MARWKWATSQESGEPILIKGCVEVHIPSGEVSVRGETLTDDDETRKSWLKKAQRFEKRWDMKHGDDCEGEV